MLLKLLLGLLVLNLLWFNRA